MNATSHHAEPGDVIIVGSHTIGGASGVERRIGEILEVRGDPGRERYRVLWDDDHESIFVPSDDMTIRRHAPHLASVELMRELGAAGVASSISDIRGRRRLWKKRLSLVCHPRLPRRCWSGLLMRTSAWSFLPPNDSRSRSFVGPRAPRTCDSRPRTSSRAVPRLRSGSLPPFGGPPGDRVIVDDGSPPCNRWSSRRIENESLRIDTTDLLRLTNADVADVVVG